MISSGTAWEPVVGHSRAAAVHDAFATAGADDEVTLAHTTGFEWHGAGVFTPYYLPVGPRS